MHINSHASIGSASPCLMCVKVVEMKQPSLEAIISEEDQIVPQLFRVVLGYNPNVELWGFA